MIAPNRVNMRHLRAQRLEAELMNRLSPILDQCAGLVEIDLYRQVSGIIRSVLTDQGVEVLTDRDRHEAGLPARGPDGWTIEEVLAYEKRRLELLMRPVRRSGG